MSAVIQPAPQLRSTDSINAQAAEIARVFATQQQHAIRLRSSTAAERKAKIQRLLDVIEAHRADIYRALYADFKKPEPEVDIGEITSIYAEGKHAIRALKKWMRPQHVMPTRLMFGTRCHVRYEPKGVTLIVAPWNYPVNLIFTPLISALAAGCTAILKPSEVTPNTAAVIRKIVQEAFSEEEVALFEGDAQVTQQLMAHPFDHIFFTGSPAVGKIVMAAAAKHLTSVTLELGGKSPAVVDASANIKNAAKSIAFGKFGNNGQTCIAPDYIYVEESVKDQFITELKAAVEASFGDAQNQGTTPDYGRIVNSRHHGRVKGLLDDAVNHGAKVEFGGVTRTEDNFIAPTVLTGVKNDSKIMQEEIFGPLLPIITFRDVQEAIDHINANPKPLALYVYSRTNRNIKRVIESTSAGGSCINTCLVQYLHGNLPFGGVNNSGIGSGHGFWGFKSFSHERAVVRDLFAATQLLIPPYTGFVRWMIKFLIRFST
ncbi:MAG: aldehyde dehydrogenase family protein [Nevskiales bacterium]